MSALDDWAAAVWEADFEADMARAQLDQAEEEE